MISTMSMRRLVLLGVVGMAMALSDVAACGGGKGKAKNSYNSDPCEDDVTSPPGMPYTSAPSAAPSKPTRAPTRVPTSTPAFSPTTKPTIAPSKSSTRSSTLNPSTAPSKSPTRSPTLKPTIAPSKSPTRSPTLKPSTAPSKSPTRSPTLKPTIAPSKSLAQLPTPKHSIASSKSPTGSPSKDPTQSTTTPSPTTLTAASAHSFSPTTTGAPSESKCAVSEDGFFGDTSDNVVVVTFGYELEYEQGYDESEIISGLEISFSDFLLPLLFASQCPDERRRVLTSFRRLETVGFSKRPDDVVLQDVACAKKQDGNECVVLDGSMTIYTDDGTSADEEMILEELKTGMENGAFAEAPIVRVSYIDLDSDASGAGGKGAGTTETTQSRRFVYGIVAVVATLLLLSLAVVWRRKNKNEATSTLSPDITADPVDPTASDGGI